MLARAQQNQGRHHATLDELIPYSPLSRRTLRYGLAAACKAGFVTVQNGVYQMQGTATIAARLNVANPGRAVAITIKADLAQFRAAIYSAWLAQRRDQRPSRAEIRATFGVSLPTLLAWEKTAGVQVRERIIIAPLYDDVNDDQTRAARAADEIERHRTNRTWIEVRGPRLGLIAGRRLMDNTNGALLDYWEVQQEPAWEAGARCWLAWQSTNDYQSTQHQLAISGRGSWLQADIKRRIPDSCGRGSRDVAYRRPLAIRAADEAAALKKQGARGQRDRPAVVECVTAHQVTGKFLRSRVAVWGA